MSTRKPTLVILIAAVAVAFLCILPLKAQQRGREAKDNSAKIADALQEMRKVAKQLVALRKQAYQAGEISFQELVMAQRTLLDLELKLAKAPADRIKVLSQQLQLAKDAERLANDLFKSGQASQGDVLQARIDRMHIEVLILEVEE